MSEVNKYDNPWDTENTVWKNNSTYNKKVLENAVSENYGVFKKVSPTLFKRDLQKILANKDILYQGGTSWCGAIASLYLSAKLNEKTFAQNTKDLYNKGYIRVGRFTFDLDASNDLYEETPEDMVNGTGISNTATFIAVTTFKNNYRPLNGLGGDLDSDEYKSEFWGITYPEDVVDYLTTFCDLKYKEGDGKFDFVNGSIKAPIDLLYWNPVDEIIDFLKNGYSPLIVVDNNKLNGGEGKITSQHYLVVKSFEYKKVEKEYKATFFNPNGGTKSKTYTKVEWEGIINWYGGFKSK